MLGRYRVERLDTPDHHEAMSQKQKENEKETKLRKSLEGLRHVISENPPTTWEVSKWKGQTLTFQAW